MRFLILQTLCIKNTLKYNKTILNLNASLFKKCSLYTSSISQEKYIFNQWNYPDYTKFSLEDLSEKINKLYKQYQNFVGITEILEAQEKVTMLTDMLFNAQKNRIKLQARVESAHREVLETHQRITKSELYSEDHYTLFNKARDLNIHLKDLQDEFSIIEEEERKLFTELSAAIRLCHAKERTQSENSKYWSILISIFSASVGALITSINNWVRIKNLKEHATDLHKDSMKAYEGLKTDLLATTQLFDQQTQDKHKVLLELINTTIQDEVRNIEESVKTILNKEESSSENKSECLPLIEMPKENVFSKSVICVLTGVILGYLGGKSLAL